jgi:hypothetical protein
MKPFSFYVTRSWNSSFAICHSSFLLAFLLSSVTLAQPSAGKDALLSIKHTTDFEVTGNGTDPAWGSAEWITLPRIKGASAYATKVKLLYSDKGIYALYNCEDRKITSTLREDFTPLWKEDVIEIFFWTDESIPIYFEYELSPLNYELAILVPNLNGRAAGWTPWNYKGEKKTKHTANILTDEKQNPAAWIGEFFIPYILLQPLQNVPPKKGTQWRVNMYRIDYDEKESSYWAWQPVKTNFHEYKSYGSVLFD